MFVLKFNKVYFFLIQTIYLVKNNSLNKYIIHSRVLMYKDSNIKKYKITVNCDSISNVPRLNIDFS